MNNQFSIHQQPTAAMTINNSSTNQSGNSNDIKPINISFSRNNSIFDNTRLRRESIAHSQGMGGVSWGSIGIGSWLKDEVFMHQNANNNYLNQLRNQSINLNNGNFNNNNAMDLRSDSVMVAKSPLPHSSYLADLEANYCKDYSCCGQLLPTLHDLLKHYEEMHIANDGSDLYQSNLNNFHSTSNLNNEVSNARIRNTNVPVGAVSTNEVFLNNHLNTKQNLSNNNKKFNMNPSSNKQKQANNLDFNMSLTDNNNNNQHSSNNIHNDVNLQNNELHKTLSSFNFDQSNIQSQEMQFDFSNSNGSHIFQNDVLVKDLENQTKMFHQQVQQQENNHLSHDQQLQQHNNYQSNFNNNHNFSNNTNMNTHNKIQKNQNIVNSNLEMDMDPDTQFQMDVDDETHNGEETPDVCIDDPARRLYVMEQKDERPFSCPVIGCDKTYKNQNGLKYHRIHGHQNQTLRENPDGTLSVINPDSDSPYPHGMGFEKDKPYRCEVCGKRYKNLNGLKYHRGHTTH